MVSSSSLPMSKKTFVIIARFLLLGLFCAMAHFDRVGARSELMAGLAVFGLTNLFLLFQPRPAFEHKRFSTWIFAFDTFAVSLFIFFLKGNAAELYLAYFLTIFIAGIGRSSHGALCTSVVSCAIYWLLTLYGRTGVELYSFPFAMRMAFFVTTALLVGYLAEEVERERMERRGAQELLRQTSPLAILFDISNKLVSTTNLQDLYRHTVEGAVRVLEADAGSIMVVDNVFADRPAGPASLKDGLSGLPIGKNTAETQILRVEAAIGENAQELSGTTLRMGERIAGRVAEQGAGILIQGHAGTCPQFASYASPRRIQSSVCVPLKIGQRVLGVLNMNRIHHKEPFGQEDLDLLTILANHAALVLDRVLLYNQVEKLSKTDRLLGVYNRGAFEERLAEEVRRAQRYGRPLCLTLVDLDHFKAYNDCYGHQGGDDALRQVVSAIESGVRNTDMVARYGGDEIAIILPETGVEGASLTAERIRKAVAALDIAVRDNGSVVPLTTSMGVAEFNPATMRTKDDLIWLSDIALYSAKEKGRNSVVTFSRESVPRGSKSVRKERGSPLNRQGGQTPVYESCVATGQELAVAIASGEGRRGSLARA